MDLWSESFPDATNTGMLTLRTPTLDIDIEYTEAAEALEQLVHERFGDHGHVLTRIGKSPKRAIPFRTETPFAKITQKVIRADGMEERFEFLSDGQQVVVDGIHPDTHQPYRWAHGDLLTVPRADLPLISAADAQALRKDAAELLTVEYGYRDKSAPRPRGTVDGAPPSPADWVAYFDEENLIDHDNNAAAIMALIRGGTHPEVVSNLFQQKISALNYRGPPGGQAEWEARRARRLPRSRASSSWRCAKSARSRRTRHSIQRTHLRCCSRAMRGFPLPPSAWALDPMGGHTVVRG